VAFVEFAPKQEGRNMTMVLGTNVKKGQSVSQQKAAKVASKAAAVKEESAVKVVNSEAQEVAE
jgi:translation initiation factor IF-3